MEIFAKKIVLIQTHFKDFIACFRVRLKLIMDKAIFVLLDYQEEIESNPNSSPITLE